MHSAHLRHILFIFIACTSVCANVHAQTSDSKKLDAQLEDRVFFDPSQKQKKKEVYHFGTEYRLEVGYTQPNQRTKNYSAPNMYLHGVRIGGTVNFLLPLHFSVQTGLLYSLSYGQNDQHWRSMRADATQVEYIRHRILQHNLTIPVRAYYTIPLWKQLNLFFMAGPQLQIGLAEMDYPKNHLSQATQTWLQQQGIPTEKNNRLANDLYHTTIQLGLGGGLEWDKYRIEAGYDFGLNNRIRQKVVSNQHLWEWGWYTTFSYRF